MKKPGTILLMAVVLGALVSAWVYNLIRARDREVEAARRAAAGETLELVVAAAEIPIGTRIDNAQVRTLTLARRRGARGAVKRTEDVVGQIACVTIEKNHPVRAGPRGPGASACCPCSSPRACGRCP
jgi:Flp pilus assembly protein CpaB